MFFIFSVRRTRPWHEYSVLFDMLGFRLIPLQNITNKYICCCFSSFFFCIHHLLSAMSSTAAIGRMAHTKHTHTQMRSRACNVRACSFLLIVVCWTIIFYSFVSFRICLFVCGWVLRAHTTNDRHTECVIERERLYIHTTYEKRWSSNGWNTRRRHRASLPLRYWTVQWNVGFFIFTHRIGAVWWRMWKNWKWRQNFCCFSCV